MSESPAPPAPASESEAVSRRDGSALDSPWTRIKEHKVLQWSLAYLGAALALAHAQDLVGHAFNWPEGFSRITIGVLAVGLPIAIAVAWYHGHKGMTRFSTAEATIVSLLVVLGAGMLAVFVRTPDLRPSDAVPNVAHTSVIDATKSPSEVGSSPAEAEPSIAVLPFVNMSNDRDQEYFSDGLSEELLNQLAQLPNLRVIGRTSSFAFKGKNEDLRTIGVTLGVNHILEGSVRKSADRLRITAQLINPADGSHIWSATYDRGSGDVFSVQEEIARTVASALRVSIGLTDLGQGGTRNLEAHDAFLRSLDADPLAAMGYLERAVELDPSFANAWAHLANLYGNPLPLFVPDRSAEWQQKEVQSTAKLLALAPDSQAAKLLRAQQAMNDGRLNQAEQLFMSLQGSAGGLASDVYAQYGGFLMTVGKARESLESFSRAVELDPFAQFPSIGREIDYESLGDYARAAAEAQRSQSLGSRTADPVGPGMAIVRAMEQRDTASLKRILSEQPDDRTGAAAINRAMLPLLEQPSEALARLKGLYGDPAFPVRIFTLTVVAQWAAYFKDPEFSLEVTRRLPSTGVPAGQWMLVLWRPIERDVRRLPAFKDFVRAVGLVDYWRASGTWGEFCRPVGATDFVCN
jgi:TolB-like protein